MRNTTDLNSGMRCIKYLLFLFNLLFVITGVLVICVGLTIQYIYFDYEMFLHSSFVSPASLLIAVGIIIFLVAFFGCCGAIKESTCMIMVFAVMMAMIFVLELSAAIAGLAMQDDVIDGIRGRINYTMNEYEQDKYVAQTVDFLQDTLSCCGMDEPTDWIGRISPGVDTVNVTVPGLSYSVPQSCCAVYYGRDLNATAGKYPTCKYIFGNGCYKRLEYVVSRSSVTLTSAAICLALLQLLGVVFACSLGKTIRVQKTERERRRWELRETLINSYVPGDGHPKVTTPVIYIPPAPEQDC